MNAMLPLIRAAARQPHDINARLYTDGHRVKWLTHASPGWERIGAIKIKKAA